jgi:SP family sugar:H+ symporter-like MFS transporter
VIGLDGMANTTNRNAIALAVFIAFGESQSLTRVPSLSPINPCCCAGGFLFGYDIGIISGCLIMPNFIETFGELGPDGEYILSSSRQSIITPLLSAG